MNKETLKGWKQYRLNDLFIINPPKDNISNDTEVSFIAMKDVSDAGYLISSEVKRFEEVKNGYTYFKNDDVILAKITPCFENGKMAVLSNLTNNYGVGSTEFYVFRKRPNANILPQILYYIFKEPSFRKNAIMHMSGAAGQKRVQRKFLEYYPLSIPLTTAEQQEIVQVLDTMSDIIRLREECISHAQDLIPALFQEMFDNPQTNKKNWQICCLKDLAKIDRQNISPEELKTKQYTYIGLEHIEKETGRILVDPNSQQDIDLKSNKFFFTSNHVLYGKLRPYLNKVALPNFDGVCSTDIFPLLPLEGISNKYFLKVLMSTSYFVSMANSQSSGANLPRIGTTALENIKVFKPDYTLQEQFAQKVIEIESYIKEQQEELENAKQVFQSLLHHAFTGELTKHKYGEINE